MSEIDQIRKRKFEELKRAQSSQSSQENKLANQIEQLEAVVKPLFTREALTRYGTIKTAFPERAVQVLLVLGKASQAGQVNQVDDELLKKLLAQLTPQKRETRIRGI